MITGHHIFMMNLAKKMRRELFSRPPEAAAGGPEAGASHPDPHSSSKLSQASLISEGIVVTGDLVISGRLHVDGTIHGTLRGLDGHLAVLVIGESGCVEGDITVPELVIYGTTTGDILAIESIEIASTAHVLGDISYHAARIHAGAVIDGQLIYIEKPESG
jgi:cytoskeletal protein CcmA (bactofilin family)